MIEFGVKVERNTPKIIKPHFLKGWKLTLNRFQTDKAFHTLLNAVTFKASFVKEAKENAAFYFFHQVPRKNLNYLKGKKRLFPG